MGVDVSTLNQYSWVNAGANNKNVKNDSIVTGHSVIKLTPNWYYYGKERNNLSPVVGVTLNRVNIGISSEWQAQGVPKLPFVEGAFNNPFYKGASELSVAGAGGELGSVWMSKQLWRKNGYLSISPEFRITDWDGTGRPLSYALQIAKLCLPGKSDGNIKKTIEQLKSAVGRGVESAIEYADGKQEAWGAEKLVKDNVDPALLDAVGNLASDTVSRLHSISKTYLDDIHDIITLKNAPPPVKVQIGQYFYHPDMIIKNANFNFSKEVSDLGPLYVDVTLDMQTRKIVSGLDDVGFMPISKLKSRAKIYNSNHQLPKKSVTQEPPVPTFGNNVRGTNVRGTALNGQSLGGLGGR
tara:strand:- start:1133 stop:2191 length:1059 start_codon:yes stop_codon:yes gene_type:complete